MTKISLGEYIKRLREEKSWSQRDLESRSGIDQGTISKIEKDETQNPGIKAFIALSKALNVPIDNLIHAFQGNDPEKIAKEPEPNYKNAVISLINELPKEWVLEAIINKKGADLIKQALDSKEI